MAAASRRLSGLDTAFLCLERDITPMQLGALAVLRPSRPARPEQIAALVAERAGGVPRLGRRVQRAWYPPGAATWADDPAFRVADHVRLHHLPPPGGHHQAAELAAELMARPLRRDRPLWECHVMSGLDDCRFAVLVKLHHALADGLAALEIGLGLLDEIPGADGAAGGRAGDNGARGVRAPAATARRRSIVRGVLAQPFRLVRGVGSATGGAVWHTADLLGMASSVLRSARLPAQGSPLVTISSGQRALGLARLDLDQVRRIRSHFGGTVNDILLAVVAGALREWQTARGRRVAGLSLRALIPMSRRARANGRAGSNQMSGYLCELPVGEPDPARRLRAIQQTMLQRKAAGTTRGAGAIPLLADQLPPAVHRLVAPVAGQVAALLFDVLVTSVPVPAVPLRLGGAELEEIFPITPLAPGHALGVALSSYRGAVYLGLHADRAALPDVQGLAEAVPVAVAELDGVCAGYVPDRISS